MAPFQIILLLTTVSVYCSQEMESTTAALLENNYSLDEPYYSDYQCPRNCDCATLGVYIKDKVQLLCSILFITPSTTFSVIQGPMTSVLTIVCDPYHVSEFNSTALEHLTQLTELTILKCNLEHLPSELIWKLTNLKSLTIYIAQTEKLIIDDNFFMNSQNLENITIGGRIEKLPVNLCTMKQLKNLDLSANYLSNDTNVGLLDDQSDDDLPCLPKLQTLDLSYNLLTEITRSVCDLMPKLEKLYLQHNMINLVVDDIFENCKTLIEVNLSFNQLVFLSPQIFQSMYKIHVLNVAHNNINSLANVTLSNMIYLRSLNISSNAIHHIPSNYLENLHNLEELNVSNTRIQSLDKDTFLNITSLKHLYLGGNLLQVLQPGTFEYVKNLETLDINGNHLETIQNGTFDNLSVLTTLNLTNNWIIHIDKSAFQGLGSQLQSLYLAHNRLTYIPQAVSTLESLHLLDLAYNQLLLIDKTSFFGLKALQILRLKHNRISYLSSDCLGNLPSIILMNLDNNNINDIERSSFNRLPNTAYLNLNNNNITDISFRFTQLRNLRILWLSNNKILALKESTHLPQSLEYIDLSYNKIVSIDSGMFIGFPNLKEVNLQFNDITEPYKGILQVDPKAATRPNFKIAFNEYHCTCKTTYLKSINQLNDKRYAFIEDLDSIICFTEERAAFVVDLAAKFFLCPYTEECDITCQCCIQQVTLTCPCLGICPEQCSCLHSEDRNYNIVNCSNQAFTEIPTNLSHHTTVLDLSGHHLTKIHAMSFKDGHYLNSLFLNNGTLEYIESKAFEGAGALKVINLELNQMKVLKHHTFIGAYLLEEINLRLNNLVYIENETFTSLHFLSTLRLDHNNLKFLNLHAILPLDNEFDLYLGFNPWNCSCLTGEILQHVLIEWASSLKDSGNISCDYVENSIKLNEISKFEETDSAYNPVLSVNFDYCENITINRVNIVLLNVDEGMQTIYISLVILLVFSITTISSLVYFRVTIQILIFDQFGVRLRKKAETSRYYHAFISSCEKDSDFVFDQIIPNLESKSHVRLCVPDRDWLGGEGQAECILTSIRNSSRTIVLLSDNYIEDEWCQLQFNTAYHKAFEDRFKHIIIILLQDRPPKKMFKELKSYMKTGLYLKYKDPRLWKKLLFYMPSLNGTRHQNGQEIELCEGYINETIQDMSLNEDAI